MENLTETKTIENLISNKSSELINKAFSQIFYKLKPILITIAIILIILIFLYIIYRIIKFIIIRTKEKRIKDTYKNTELILEKLDKIEEKLNELIKPRKKEKPSQKQKQKVFK